MALTIDLLIRNVRIVTCVDDACAVSPPAFVAIAKGLIAGLGRSAPWTRAGCATSSTAKVRCSRPG